MRSVLSGRKVAMTRTSRHGVTRKRAQTGFRAKTGSGGVAGKGRRAGRAIWRKKLPVCRFVAKRYDVNQRRRDAFAAGCRWRRQQERCAEPAGLAARTRREIMRMRFAVIILARKAKNGKCPIRQDVFSDVTSGNGGRKNDGRFVSQANAKQGNRAKHAHPSLPCP